MRGAEAGVSSRPAVWRLRQVAVVVLQGVLGLVFLVAGLDKLLVSGAAAFGVMLSNLLSLPGSSALGLARALAFSEICLAAWLLSGRAPRTSARATAMALAFYTVALVRLGFMMGWRHDCGCHGFSMGGSTIIWAIVRNVVLLPSATLLALLLHRRDTCDTVAMRPQYETGVRPS